MFLIDLSYSDGALSWTEGSIHLLQHKYSILCLQNTRPCSVYYVADCWLGHPWRITHKGFLSLERSAKLTCSWDFQHTKLSCLFLSVTRFTNTKVYPGCLVSQFCTKMGRMRNIF